MSQAGEVLRDMAAHGITSFAVCPVCGGDRRICHHEADEHYDALLTEARRHLLSYTEGYNRLLHWHQKYRRERGEMKRRIKELEAQHAKTLARLRLLQEEM